MFSLSSLGLLHQILPPYQPGLKYHGIISGSLYIGYILHYNYFYISTSSWIIFYFTVFYNNLSKKYDHVLYVLQPKLWPW